MRGILTLPINSIVDMFNRGYRKEKYGSPRISRKVEDHLSALVGMGWAKFKESEKKKSVFSKKLSRKIVVSGNKFKDDMHSTWKPQEVESIANKKLEKDQIDRILMIREMFCGRIL